LYDQVYGHNKLSALPEKMSLYSPFPTSGNCWETTRVDNNGDELNYLLAKDFKEISWVGCTEPMDLAAKAFVDVLPDNTRLILYWL